MDTLTELFCRVDDFCQVFMPEFEKQLLETHAKKRHRLGQMATSEIMTILIYFHQLRFRDFKTYYQQYVQVHLQNHFPRLVSYTRVVELMPSLLLPLCFFIHSQPKSHTGIYFVDATTLDVCHIKRASSHKVFKGLAKKGKSSMGWFFGVCRRAQSVIQDISHSCVKL
jgi:hypothetical protein